METSIASNMADLVSDGLQKSTGAVGGHLGAEPAKIKDLQCDVRETSSADQPITTDYGIRVSNTDNWLKVATEQATGPLLLEDPIAREKGRRAPPPRQPRADIPGCRSTASTTSVSRNVWSTRAERLHLASSHSSRAQRTSPTPVSLRIPRERLPSSSASPRYRDLAAAPTRFGMCEALLSNSTPRKEIGTLWEITSPSFLFRNR
jgi:hypothetical protein